MTDAGTEVLEDNADFAPTRKEGWLEFVNRPPREMPEICSQAQLKKLTGRNRLLYDERRKIWHANLGPIRTPQMNGVHEDLDEIVDAARQDGDKVKGGAVIDAHPGLGKTTIALQFAKRLHQEQVELYGDRTAEGHERLPVAFVTLSGSVTVKGLNRALCRFYGMPSQRGSTDELADRALDAVLSCRTRLIVVDDVHFLNPNRSDDRAVVNHLKHLASILPVTFVFVGVGIEERRLEFEGFGPHDSNKAQLARRWTPLRVDPFEIGTEKGRITWRRLLLSIEQLVVLSGKHPGMLAEDLADYLFARSTGHFASLMTIVQRGCRRAIKTGEERLTKDLLDRVKNDAAAERTRLELQSAFEQGLLSSRPRRSA